MVNEVHENHEFFGLNPSKDKKKKHYMIYPHRFLVLVDKGDRHPVDLVKVCSSWLGHHGYQKKDALKVP